jgi:hypothetical protein
MERGGRRDSREKKTCGRERIRIGIFYHFLVLIITEHVIYAFVIPCFFHLTTMHSSGNIVSEIFGTRSSFVGNIRNEYTHVPRWFH